jgi:glutamate dehydrogenase/leucine dehydrogenase
MTELQAAYADLGPLRKSSIFRTPAVLSVRFPVRMTTGKTRIFTGYRVQYNRFTRACQGRDPVPP